MDFRPFNAWREPTEEMIERGRELIAKRRVGCLILAGGQGTRLGVDGPKGLFEILPGKTLIGLLSEKFVEGCPVAALVCKGVTFEGIASVEQGELPFLDEGKELDVTGPNGNGDAFQAMKRSGLLERWQEMGIEVINIVLVDNLRAEPFDAALVGLLVESEADVAIKVTKRRSVDEKVGLVVEGEEGIEVVEYSEAQLGEEFECANLSLMAVTMDFAQEAAKIELPFHEAKKRIPGSDRMAIKREQFIFDVLPHAGQVAVLMEEREKCFLPLKSKEDVERVREALK